MLTFLTAPANLPFAIALAIVLAIAVVEVVALLLGASISGLFDSPDSDVDLDIGANTDIDADIDVDGIDTNFDFLHAIGFGHIPLMAYSVVVLSMFALLGFVTQAIGINATGRFLPIWPVAIGDTVLTLFLAGRISPWIKRTLFREDSEASSAEDFLGGTATIVLGKTHAGHPTQAKITDRFGHTHYVLVEAKREGAEYDTGDRVVLVSREGPKYYVVGESVEELFEERDELRSEPSDPSSPDSGGARRDGAAEEGSAEESLSPREIEEIAQDLLAEDQRKEEESTIRPIFPAS